MLKPEDLAIITNMPELKPLSLLMLMTILLMFIAFTFLNGSDRK